VPNADRSNLAGPIGSVRILRKFPWYGRALNAYRPAVEGSPDFLTRLVCGRHVESGTVDVGSQVGRDRCLGRVIADP